MEENRSKSEMTPEERRLANLKRDAGPGRPKGQKNYATLYREALIKIAEANNKDPNELELEIVSKGIAEARKGDYRFYQDLLDRLHGKPQQSIDHTSDGEPIKGFNYVIPNEPNDHTNQEATPSVDDPQG